MAELLQQLVTGQAERRPDAVALVMNDERLSYATLEDASNQLARLLQAVGWLLRLRALARRRRQPDHAAPGAQAHAAELYDAVTLDML